MALPQQLPGVSVVPQAPQVDPRLFAPDAAGMLLSARAGVQLGTELAGLQNLQGKLELEKAEIAARKAQNAYQQKLATDAAQILPQQIQSQLDKALAESAQSKATVRTADPLATAAIADAASRTAGSQFSLAQTEAGIKGGIPQFTVELQRLELKNKKKAALADVDYSKLSTSEKAGQVAQKTAEGSATGTYDAQIKLARSFFNPSAEQTSMPQMPFNAEKSGGLSASIKNGLVNRPFSPFIRYIPTDIEDPITKRVRRTYKAFSTLDNSPVPDYDRPGDDIDLRQGDSPDAKKVIALDQTLKLAEDAKGALKLYADENRGGYWQTVAADYANTPAKGLASIGTRAFGTWLQSTETASMNAKLAALSNTIIKDLSGSGVTGDEFSRLTTMLPTTGDLVNPKAAQAKLDQTIKYINTLAETYKKRKSDTQSRLGNLSDQAAPASVGQGLLGVTGRRGQVKELNGRNYEFVVLPSGLSGWKAQ